MPGTENLASSIVETLSRAAPSVRYTFRSRDFGVDALDATAMRRRIAGFAATLRSEKIPARTVTPIVAGSSAALWAAFVGAIGADLIPCILPVPTFKPATTPFETPPPRPRKPCGKPESACARTTSTPLKAQAS